MTTIRRHSRPADRFTMISNEFHRDARLSLAARGLGGYLLSHVDGWEITVQRLAKDQGVGREQMRRLLRELEECGYLRRIQDRSDDGRMGGMVYQISCTPADNESPGHNRCPENRTPVNRGPVSDHHKKTSPKDNTSTGDQPSGGHAGARLDPTPDREEDDPMPPAQQPALDLDLPEPEEPDKKPKKVGNPSAATVVAAFVDSYRRHHSGGNPLKSVIGRVARDARQLLDAGRATVAELSTAATAMGATPFAALGVQLDIARQGGPKQGTARGPVPPSPASAFKESALAQMRTYAARMHTDPEAVAWVIDDPDQVAQFLELDPSLAEVFARAGAA